jgi:hypothetical protein
MTDKPIARREDWKTEPLPDQHVTLLVEKTYTAQEMSLIRLGVIPEEMEDKWFIFYEDDTLHCHRSWTGNCIYQAQFVEHDDVFVCTQVRANRDQDQYRAPDDEDDVKSFLRLVSIFLLHDWSAL